ncbi:MAG: DNA-directed RNA polymerase subunit omega [Clostridiaceae bacterium]|jgi:DNA-directed RNA polymerase subunit omega|nr:DNA-directed RNA polymerase subunit omega [Clostridiaceae bacterium]
MLIYPSTEELLKRVDNRYILAMLASRRARQLTSGARPVIDSDTRNRVSLASEEIHAGRVVFRFGKHNVIVPEDPLIIAAREAAEREARAKEEEERLEEASRSPRVLSREQSPTVFESAGISVEDASLIAERFISHVERMEQAERAEEEAKILAASEEDTEDDENPKSQDDETDVTEENGMSDDTPEEGA